MQRQTETKAEENFITGFRDVHLIHNFLEFIVFGELRLCFIIIRREVELSDSPERTHSEPHHQHGL